MALLVVVVSAASYAATTVNPLQETMRATLSLTDNQVGLLQGPALALPMIVAAVPLGLLIDRYSRVRLLLALTVANMLGGIATAFAFDFSLLLAARCLIGFTAFAVAPVGLSLIGDLYAPSQRGRASMVMSLGQSFGVASSFALGGMLLAFAGMSRYAWRIATLGLSTPLFLVALATLAMREPRRAGGSSEGGGPSAGTWAELWEYRAMIVLLLFGVVMGQIALGAVYVWSAPMLTRQFTLSSSEVGDILAVGLFAAGALGAVLGGTVADLCQRAGGPRRTCLILSASSLVSVPFALFAFMLGVFPVIALLLIYITIANSLSVVGTTVFIVAVPNQIRGRSIAIMTAACVVIGTGFAPLSVSMLADMLGGPAMIGRALSAICAVTGALGAAGFLTSRRFLPEFSQGTHE